MTENLGNEAKAPRLSRDAVRAVIYESIDEINSQFALDIRKQDGLALVGDGSGLDSLAFVNFVAAVEEKCQQRFGAQLSLTDEASDDGALAHFASVDALTTYVLEKCTE